MDDLGILNEQLKHYSAIKMLPEYATQGYYELCSLVLGQYYRSFGRIQDEQKLLDQTLLNAVESNSLAIVKLLIQYKADVNAEDAFAIIQAVKLGRLNILQYLLENGADVHVRNDDILILALNGDHPESTIKLLLKWGKDIDIHADDDYILFLAIAKKNAAIVSMLLDHGASLTTHWENTPWEEAKRLNCPDIMQLLREAKHEREERNKQ